MNSILDRLYNGDYSVIDRKSSPEYQAASQETEPFWETIGETLGMRFCTDFSDALAGQATVQEKEAFREGFHLGGQLILELLTRKENTTPSL